MTRAYNDALVSSALLSSGLTAVGCARANVEKRLATGILILAAAWFSLTASAEVPNFIVPTFRVTLQIQNGNAIVSWPATTNKVQVQSATRQDGPWQNVGGPTTASSITTPITGSMVLYRGMIANSTSGPWSQSFGSSGYDYGMAVAADKDSNVLLTGQFSNPVDFGGGPVGPYSQNIILLAKYTANGGYLWAKGFGLTASGQGQAVKTDANGNIYWAGVFGGTLNLGGNSLPSVGENDVFVAKFAPDGTHIWSKSFGSAGNDTITGLALDSHGDVVICGTYGGTVSFGGQILSTGGSSIFLAKLSSTDGSHVWSSGFGTGSLNDSASGVAVDNADNVVMTGTSAVGTSLGGGILAGGIFVAKYSSSGAHSWSQSLGGVGQADTIVAPAVDANGNIAISGSFAATFSISSGTLVGGLIGNVFVAKLNPDGTGSWAKQFGNAMMFKNYTTGIAFDRSGDVVVAGDFLGSTMDFGGGTLASAGGYDIFLAKLSSVGTHIWSKSYGGSGVDYCNGLALDPNDNEILTGDFVGSADFGGGPLASQSLLDIFLSKHAP